MDELEYGYDGGLDFRICDVGREHNREADALAVQALDEAEA